MDALQVAIMRARSDARVVKARPEPKPMPPEYRDFKPSSLNGPMANEVTIKSQIWETIPFPIHPITKIQQCVALFYKVSVIDICADRKTSNIVKPRQIAMYLAKMITLKSLPEIGRRFGKRDHTTVLHAVRKIESLISSDANIAAEIAELRAMLST